MPKLARSPRCAEPVIVEQFVQPDIGPDTSMSLEACVSAAPRGGLRDDLAWMAEALESRTLSRGEIFYSFGQACHDLAVLQSGLLYVHASSSSGHKFVLDFLFPGTAAVPMESVINGTPSEVCIEAIEDSVLLVWPRAGGRAGCRLASLRLEKRMIEAAMIRKSQRFLSLLTTNAAERYARLDKEFPPNWRAIPQHLLAAYLAVTPQYLCRLKRG